MIQLEQYILYEAHSQLNVTETLMQKGAVLIQLKRACLLVALAHLFIWLGYSQIFIGLLHGERDIVHAIPESGRRISTSGRVSLILASIHNTASYLDNIICTNNDFHVYVSSFVKYAGNGSNEKITIFTLRKC